MIVDCSNLIQLEIGNTTQSSSSSPSPDNNMFTAVEQVTVRSTTFDITIIECRFGKPRQSQYRIQYIHQCNHCHFHPIAKHHPTHHQ